MDMEVKKVVTLKISQDILFTEAPVGAEEDSKLGDFIQDDETISPTESTNRGKFSRRISKKFSNILPSGSEDY